MSNKESNKNPSYDNDEFTVKDLDKIRKMRELCLSILEGSEELSRIISTLEFDLEEYLEAAPNIRANLTLIIEELKRFQTDIGE